jgi:hypothetical protein
MRIYYLAGTRHMMDCVSSNFITQFNNANSISSIYYMKTRTGLVYDHSLSLLTNRLVGTDVGMLSSSSCRMEKG